MIRRIVLAVLLIAGVAASCFVIGQRARVESRNKAVEIVLDYTEAEQVAASIGRTPAEVLFALRRSGATSVAITEQTIQDLIDARLIVPYGAHTFAVRKEISGRVRDRLRATLEHGTERVQCTPLSDPNYEWLTVTADIPLEYLRLLPVGLSEYALDDARAAGVEVVTRMVNYPGATPAGIRSALENVRSLGVKKVIFQGDQVLGFKGSVKQTGNALKHVGLCFGWIEFSKQKGDSQLARSAPGNLIVVHSIPQNEMPALSLSGAVERFQRAVKERGARMCYVRMYDTAAPNLLAADAAYVSGIATAIESAGYTVKSSHRLEQVAAPLWTRVFVGAGVGAAGVLLLLAIWDLSVLSCILWAAVTILCCAGLAATGDMGRKVVALDAAFIFPTLAALWAARRSPDAPAPVARPMLRALGRFLLAVVTVAAGGALVTGLLSERSFMLRTDQFVGIKLAFVLPIITLTVLFLGGIGWTSDTYAAQKARFWARLRQVASSPILMWQAAGIAVLLGAVAVMVLRSGNEPGVGVSDFELKIRAILDRLMVVRPRTKEFLIGYPVLLAGIAFALRGRRQWAAPLIVIGSIGLASALNTFCHIHTPLLVSGLRLVNGAVIGAILGMILYLLIKNLPGRETKEK